MLGYFYDRNQNATNSEAKKALLQKTSDLKMGARGETQVDRTGAEQSHISDQSRMGQGRRNRKIVYRTWRYDCPVRHHLLHDYCGGN